MAYTGRSSNPSTNKPHHSMRSPKFTGPSIASIPRSSNHARQRSNSMKAASRSSMHSKKPICPTLYLSKPQVLRLIKAATRPTHFPPSSSSSQRVHSPALKQGFFSGSNTWRISLSNGRTQYGFPAYKRTGNSINSRSARLSFTSFTKYIRSSYLNCSVSNRISNAGLIRSYNIL